MKPFFQLPKKWFLITWLSFCWFAILLTVDMNTFRNRSVIYSSLLVKFIVFMKNVGVFCLAIILDAGYPNEDNESGFSPFSPPPT